MNYRNMALSAITIVMLNMFYFYGLSIGYKQFGFVAIAVALMGFTSLNTVISCIRKMGFSTHTVAVPYLSKGK